MKKTLVIILIIAFSIIPATAFSQGAVSLEEAYIQKDSSLENLKLEYTELLENREDNLQKYENMRISSWNQFYLAQSLATREKGILDIDWKINNTNTAIKAREAKLSIDFRKAYLTLFTLKDAGDDAKEDSTDAEKSYEDSVKKFNQGFISYGNLLSDEYNVIYKYYTYLKKQRSYDAALRNFNFIMYNPLDFNDYTFNFNEAILKPESLQSYLESALKNSPDLTGLRQKLKKYEIDQFNFDKFQLPVALSYVRNKLQILDLNLRLEQLNLAKSEEALLSGIEKSYKALEITKENLNLSLINIQLLKKEYEINVVLRNRGYINYPELADSKNIYREAENNYLLDVYSYNTQLKSLEYDCAYYLEESDD